MLSQLQCLHGEGMLISVLQAVVKIRDFTDFQGVSVTPWDSSHSFVYSFTHSFLRRRF